MTNQDVEHVARQMEDNFVAGDWDAYQDLLTDDMTLEMASAELQGKDRVISLARSLKEAFPDIQSTVTNSMVSGNIALLEISYEVTHTGVLRTPRGSFEPTGRRASFKVAKFVEVSDGKVIASRQYFDMVGITQQLGQPAVATS